MPATLEYEDSDGRRPFASFGDLDTLAAAKVRAIGGQARGRPQAGRAVGRERRPRGQNRLGTGYCVYFAFDGKDLILLLGGGEKHGQNDDIAAAQARWVDYKRRKRP